MYSDLFDHLNSSGGGANANANSSSNSNEKVLAQIKAGKMNLTLQENGNYWAEADTRRGEIRMVWKTNENALHWEWFDRREKTTVDRHVLYTASSGSGSTTTSTEDLGTLERVTEVPNAQPQDRIYVWSKPQTGSSSTNREYKMYWLQDASEEKDDELIAQINQYLADPASANPNTGSTSTSGTGSGGAAAGGANATTSTATSSSNNTDRQQQVDALSNILENLGMPAQGDSASSSSTPAPAAATSSASAAASRPTGTLTLADLQGAMAGLQQPRGSAAGPPLQDLVTSNAISSLLSSEDVKQKLMELLPEEQQTEDMLEENLRSPQVQQTLRSLTMALMPDDNGSMEGYHSVLANFAMQEHAQEALQNNSGNPIQAFLECVLKSVEKDKEDKSGSGSGSGGDEDMKE